MVRMLGFYAALTAAMMLLSIVALAFGGDGGAAPQEKASSQRMPSAPVQPYVVATGSSIAGTVKDLHDANKLQDLMNAPGIGCRVYIQHEADAATNQAEVHDGADDIFMILDGTAVFVLGGKLDAPKETQPGEWRAPGIVDGKEFKVSKGDILIVPRGTPHRRITKGLDVTLMLIKSFTAVKN